MFKCQAFISQLNHSFRVKSVIIGLYFSDKWRNLLQIGIRFFRLNHWRLRKKQLPSIFKMDSLYRRDDSTRSSLGQVSILKSQSWLSWAVFDVFLCWIDKSITIEFSCDQFWIKELVYYHICADHLFLNLYQKKLSINLSFLWTKKNRRLTSYWEHPISRIHIISKSWRNPP